jgi:hypothetical protein
MKKNILFYLCFILIGGLTISSCTKDEDENQFSSIDDVRGAVINGSVGGLGFYNLGDATASITLSVDDFGEDVSSVTLLKSINGAAAVEETKITSFPAELTFNLNDAVAGTGLTIDDLAVGDNVTYTFADVVTASGTYPSGRTLPVNITCPGQLTGTFAISTIATGIFASPDPYVGMVRFEDIGGGTYNVFTLIPGTTDEYFEDPSLGSYYAGYGTTAQGNLPNGDGGAGNVQVKETCGVLSFIGASQWGEIFTFSGVEVDGMTLTLTFENDYGESGVATITRDDEDWASNLSL